MLEVIVQYTDTNDMFHILPLIPQRFNFISSQGSLNPMQQQQKQAHSRSSPGSCHARRSTLPSPPSSPHQPIITIVADNRTSVSMLLKNLNFE
jgi:hypothetical protein